MIYNKFPFFMEMVLPLCFSQRFESKQGERPQPHYENMRLKPAPFLPFHSVGKSATAMH